MVALVNPFASRDPLATAAATVSGGAVGSSSLVNAGVKFTVVIGSAATWFAMPTGATKALVAPSTSNEGVRIGIGNASLSVANAEDMTISTPVARIVSAPYGFSLRRSGANDCTVTLVFGN